MLTASGDQSVALWDTLSARRVSAFHGHAGSVKSVCPMPACHDVFASGAPAARSGAPSLVPHPHRMCRLHAARGPLNRPAMATGFDSTRAVLFLWGHVCCAGTPRLSSKL